MLYVYDLKPETDILSILSEMAKASQENSRNTKPAKASVAEKPAEPAKKSRYINLPDAGVITINDLDDKQVVGVDLITDRLVSYGAENKKLKQRLEQVEIEKKSAQPYTYYVEGLGTVEIPGPLTKEQLDAITAINKQNLQTHKKYNAIVDLVTKG